MPARSFAKQTYTSLWSDQKASRSPVRFSRADRRPPVNWKPGEDVIIAGSVSDEEAKKVYPQGWKAPRPYL
jgi:hypothetical protein